MLPHYLAKVRSLNLANLTLYDFWSRQCLLSFHWICGHRTVLTSTVSTTRYRASSSSKSISRGCKHWWTEAAFAACLAWHWPDHIIYNATDEWRGLGRTKGGHFEQLLWHYSAIWQEMFRFLSNGARFLDFVCKLPQIWTSNFCKVVWQHTEGVVWTIICILLEI